MGGQGCPSAGGDARGSASATHSAEKKRGHRAGDDEWRGAKDGMSGAGGQGTDRGREKVSIKDYAGVVREDGVSCGVRGVR